MQQIYDLSKLAHDQQRQDAEKSSTTVNNVTVDWSQSKQKLEAKSGRFQTRLTERQTVTISSLKYIDKC